MVTVAPVKEAPCSMGPFDAINFHREKFITAATPEERNTHAQGMQQAIEAANARTQPLAQQLGRDQAITHSDVPSHYGPSSERLQAKYGIETSTFPHATLHSQWIPVDNVGNFHERLTDRLSNRRIRRALSSAKMRRTVMKLYAKIFKSPGNDERLQHLEQNIAGFRNVLRTRKSVQP